jgi:hypothetical protein
MNEYNVIIDLAMSYMEIEKGTNKTKQEKIDTIINKFKVVLPQNLFIEYYYFILYFLDIYLI